MTLIVEPASRGLCFSLTSPPPSDSWAEDAWCLGHTWFHRERWIFAPSTGIRGLRDGGRLVTAPEKAPEKAPIGGRGLLDGGQTQIPVLLIICCPRMPPTPRCAAPVHPCRMLFLRLLKLLPSSSPQVQIHHSSIPTAWMSPYGEDGCDFNLKYD